MLFLLFQNTQATEERQTRIDKCRKLPSEYRKDLGLDLPAETRNRDVKVDALLAFGFGFPFGSRFIFTFLLGLIDFYAPGAKVPLLLEPADGFVLVVHLERSLGFFAPGIHRHVTKLRHNSPFPVRYISRLRR